MKKKKKKKAKATKKKTRVSANGASASGGTFSDPAPRPVVDYKTHGAARATVAAFEFVDFDELADAFDDMQAHVMTLKPDMSNGADGKLDALMKTFQKVVDKTVGVTDKFSRTMNRLKNAIDSQ